MNIRRIRKQAQKGFTLIELMIVVAIIGVLASIALPAYQGYVAKSQAAAGLAEVAGAKVNVEELYGKSLAANTNALLGLQTTTPRCSTIAVTGGAAPGDAVTITCTLKGNGLVNGSTIAVARNADSDATAPSAWACSTNVDTKYKPQGC